MMKNLHPLLFNSILGLLKPYILVRLICPGNYRSFYSAFNPSSGKNVSIIKIHQPFITREMAKLIYLELMYLMSINHEDLILIQDIHTGACKSVKHSQIYLVTEPINGTLRGFIDHVPLVDDPVDKTHRTEIIKIFSYQILRGLGYLHSCGLPHQYLIPECLVINKDCDLKINNYVFSRIHGDSYAESADSKWYRAPEVIYGDRSYPKEEDAWSIGCIIAEMFFGQVLFKGANDRDQLEIIMDVVGYPSDSVLSRMDVNQREFFQKITKRPNRVDFKEYFREIESAEAIDLISKLLEFDPEERISCRRALGHPFFKILYDEEDEKDGKRLNHLIGSDDKSIDEWKELIDAAIENFKTNKSMPDVLNIS